MAAATARPGADAALGGFGGLFDLKAAGFEDPVLVAATDGVGTKLAVATAAGLHRGVGIDLVAMCVNDLVVPGAEPLFFLDYFATGRLAPEIGADVVAGIADGCAMAGCALIGGETAEMPGLYRDGDYDVAGFAVGAVERTKILPAKGGQPGDIALGMASAGVHSNGFSLVRRVVEGSRLTYDDPAPFASGLKLGEALLTPTRIYVKACLAALEAAGGADGVGGFAHITGGGLIENPPRAFGDDVALHLDVTSWTLPPVFRWLAETGGIEPMEMARTFNCGIGMVVFVRPDAADTVSAALEAAGETVFEIGTLGERAPGAPSVTLDGLSSWT